MFDQIVNELKLLAIQGIAEVERYAVTQLKTIGTAVTSKEKFDGAVEFSMKLYRAGTSGIPLLNGTTMDDDLFRKAAEVAVQATFDLIGDTVNAASKAWLGSSVAAPELPEPSSEEGK
jgi:hypothetical protein